ncbi:DUF1919 domain-containing protein [Fusobacterium sp.]|uniref:DUF1919 domain-containing protein n=1 Tax=Fusobacterium sp. TaxID=68766 RepID=UPI002606FE71|nr:DUF1919 domain-containing protein [Fusobacterium sp.]
MLKKIYKKIIKFIRREILLKNKNFTIISNNCFGGKIYEYFDLPKKSPTVGAYFFAKDYLKFLKNLEYYLSLEFRFISFKESKHIEYLSEESKNCPIGVLDDIEIIFLHYKTEKEVIEKWNRRIKRINWEKMIVKFNDQNNATEEDIIEFDKLPFKNKICFIANPIKNKKLESVIIFKEYTGKKYVLNDVSRWKNYLNIIKYLNNLK